MEKLYKLELTENQVKRIHFILEEFYSKYCTSYRLARDLKHENRCVNYFNALSEIACLMDEVESQFAKQ